MSIGIKHTKTEQRRVINRAFSLVRNGHTITNARKTVAKEVGVSPNTLWVWQNKFEMKTPHVIKTTELVRNNGATRQTVKSTTKSFSLSSTRAITSSTTSLRSFLIVSLTADL